MVSARCAAPQDLRGLSLTQHLARLRGQEHEITSNIASPLLEALRALHAKRIGHHHLSPLHAFWHSKGSSKLVLSPPCPLAPPAALREVLLDPLPDHYFPPDLWVRARRAISAAVCYMPSAQHSVGGSKGQPWRLVITSGAGRRCRASWATTCR